MSAAARTTAGDPGAPPPGAARVHALACRGGVTWAVDDWLAEEMPIALQYNSVSHAVMLATPLDLEDFAVGFSLGEGLVDSATDIHDIEPEETRDGIVLNIGVAPHCMERLDGRRRALAGGGHLAPRIERRVTQAPLDADALARGLVGMRKRQALQSATAATHAAAWCDGTGRVQVVREDVGRHTALDKLIGALARQRADASRGFFAVTSRVSCEMVRKASRAGAGVLAAFSAPTALAVRTAGNAGLTLIGSARGDDWVAYSGAGRLLMHRAPLD